MTTIILTLVGILLAAAAALMVMWYGGDAYDHGATKAEAATALSAVIQIADAVQLKQASDGLVYPAHNMQGLLDQGYLASIPQIPNGIPYLMDETGCAGCIGPRSIGIVYAIPKSEHSKAVCAEVRRSVGTLKPGQTYDGAARRMVDALAESRYGCSGDGAHFFVYAGF